MNPFDASLESLRNKFVLGAQNRLRRIRNTLRRLEDVRADDEALQESMRHFHALAGAAGTYGFPEVSASARELEQECNEHINAGRAPSATRVEAWRNEVRRLRKEFGMASTGIILRQQEQPVVDPDLRQVLLLQSYSSDRDLLTKVLSAEGMKVRVASDRATARRAIRDLTPDGLVIDLAVQGGTGVQVIDALRTSETGASAAVVLINSAEFPIEKVEAVRCGADALMDVNALPEQVADRLRVLFSRAGDRHNKILYVEPDTDQVAFVQRLLNAAGHVVKVCLDPADIEATMQAAPPDLILMEIVLPGVNGYELAQVIRQDPQWAHVPVIFTTTADHIPSDTQPHSPGAGEFIVKPIEPRLLLSTIARRLETARLQASALERDGITGLYNHSTFVRRLESWMRAGETQRRPSCLALLDVNGLSALNTRFGHHVGDQVLRDLAGLVGGDVNSSHLVARYGSDEFVMMLYDLEESDCVQLLTQLREEFSQLTRYTPDGRTFSADFSAGVARMNPAWRRPQLWLAEVEEALATTRTAGAPRFVVSDRSKARGFDAADGS